ncbi:TOBE domain-containing protein [Achromobacter ruhlandii]|uniref:TOBE domain-containing protein n=1 Tax=Achromobacter TaxID=222 RepID=UPI001467507C|nr:MULTISPECIES: TOBE domain-containing protein [Achromobacter]MCV6796798.1 TOBE domain-containing protein [Achromobacter ruhlandii]MCV6800979.1 TOBE domain-containing protein [Achromobacter ruhlandii]MCV6809862.1 TOBE domain-containing protein [Achromobacter ruhlandii]MCV6819125.1 TOBE domain-containing protein [Achromobacter ruhlandii]CAB3874282.1 hypothetical protein LMG26684_03241 [Achromobacter mucicolens]
MNAKLLGGLIMACVATSAQADGGSITLASWGGTFQKAQRQAWFTPAEKALGITIREDTTSGLADVRTQVASGKPAWDIVQQGSQSCPLMEKEGLLEKLDPAIVDTTGIPDNMKSEFQGESSRLFVRLEDGLEVSLRLGPTQIRESGVSTGQRVTLALHVEDTVLIPKEIRDGR